MRKAVQLGWESRDRRDDKLKGGGPPWHGWRWMRELQEQFEHWAVRLFSDYPEETKTGLVALSGLALARLYREGSWQIRSIHRIESYGIVSRVWRESRRAGTRRHCGSSCPESPYGAIVRRGVMNGMQRVSNRTETEP